MTAVALLTVGGLVALSFDIFRCLRRAYKNHPNWLVLLEDGIFLISAIILLVTACSVVDYGQIRWYTFILPIFGSLAYFWGISPWFGKIMTFFISIPGKITHFFSKIILKK